MRITISSREVTSGTMLLLGAVALFASVFYFSSVIAFIGLGLVFWGALLLYVRPEEHVEKGILNASILPSFTELNEIIQELHYEGEATYLPPRYFQDPENLKVYIPKQKDAYLPTPEQIQRCENQTFIKRPQGILLTPPGAELMKLFEKRLKTSFSRGDIDYLQKNMPKLFVEDLEIAENLEITEMPTAENSEMEVLPRPVIERTSDSSSRLQAEYYRVRVRIIDPICREICEESNKLISTCGTIGCPICSSIGCALTKATGAPIIIETEQTSKTQKTVEVVYKVLGIRYARARVRS
jgi:hypothetical protein